MTKLQALRTNNFNNIKRLNSGRFYLMKNKQMHNFIKTNPIVFKVFGKTD